MTKKLLKATDSQHTKPYFPATGIPIYIWTFRRFCKWSELIENDTA